MQHERPLNRGELKLQNEHKYKNYIQGRINLTNGCKCDEKTFSKSKMFLKIPYFNII